MSPTGLALSPHRRVFPSSALMTAEDALAMLRRKGYILVDANGAVVEGNLLPSPV